MTKTCWRCLAGVLALTLGGIVVFAKDDAKSSLPAQGCPHGQRERCCDGPCPQCPATGCPKPVEAPMAQAPCAPCPIPCVPPVVTPVVTPVEAPPAPAPAVAAPQVLQPVVMTTPALTNVPYRVRMEMNGGITQLELVRGDDVALKVQCDRVDVQMPSGGINAMGKVCVTAPGMEVRCNRLNIGWHTGEIAMEGQVRILCQNGQQRTEMSAESISCRLNTVGGGLDFRANGVGKVTEAP